MQVMARLLYFCRICVTVNGVKGKTEVLALVHRSERLSADIQVIDRPDMLILLVIASTLRPL